MADDVEIQDELLDKFEIDMKDEDLLVTFENWVKNSRPYHDELLLKQRVSEQYYIGNQTEKESVPSYNTNTVENRIFEATETLVPVATSRAHQFLVLPGSESEKSVSRANALQKVLSRKYETLEIQKKLETTLRHIILYRFGVLKWEWDYDNDDVGVVKVDPRLILVPKMRVDPHDLPYKIEIQEYTRKEMGEFFPDAKLDELTTEETIDIGRAPLYTTTGGTSAQKRLYRVYEVWTPDMVAWFCSKKVLEKKANPYFDFEGEELPYLKYGKKGELKIQKRLVFHNTLSRPRDPYVFFTTYDIGDEPFGSTSLAEVAIPIQDAINVQKRQIIDNLRKMGNGQVYVDSGAMSQEVADNITNEVGQIIRGEEVSSKNRVRREAGVQLPNAHFNNLQHSEATLDNLFGTHSATRGAAQAKTLGQDMLSRQQDFTRIDLLTRILNRGVSRLAEGLVQLMKMYYTEVQVVKIIGEEGAIEFVKLNRSDIEENIEIIVKSGETLPMDKVTLRTEAVQLWQLGALDPVTLFERLEFPNPAKAAERLQAWKMGQLTAETQAKIAEIQAGAAANAQAKAATETKSPTGETGRKVETPANVMQRATAGLGGGAPSLPQAPKM